MLNTDFRVQFKTLRGRYPGFDIPDLPSVMSVYYDELKGFPLDVLERAIDRAVNLSPQFFPPLGLVKNCCESIQDALTNEDKYPKAKFWPNDHGCGLEGTRITMGGARRLLMEVNAYEAVHIFCKATRCPRCPWCGIDVAEFVNPFIKKIMELWPNETRGWNPQHKGNLLCVTCEGLEYPMEFLKASAS